MIYLDDDNDVDGKVTRRGNKYGRYGKISAEWLTNGVKKIDSCSYRTLGSSEIFLEARPSMK